MNCNKLELEQTKPKRLVRFVYTTPTWAVCNSSIIYLTRYKALIWTHEYMNMENAPVLYYYERYCTPVLTGESTIFFLFEVHAVKMSYRLRIIIEYFIYALHNNYFKKYVMQYISFVKRNILTILSLHIFFVFFSIWYKMFIKLQKIMQLKNC